MLAYNTGAVLTSLTAMRTVLAAVESIVLVTLLLQLLTTMMM